MKKTTLAILFAASCISSSALAANSGNFYIQGDLLSSAISVSDSDELGGAAFGQRLSLGYAFEQVPVRIAADFTNYGKWSEEASSSYGYGNVYAKADLKIKSFGVSGFYDFKNFGDFVPYLGLRLSYNHGKMDVSASNGYSYAEGSDSETSMGLGGVLGFQYNFTKQLYLNVALEGSRLFSDVNAGSAQIGLGYRF